MKKAVIYYIQWPLVPVFFLVCLAIRLYRGAVSAFRNAAADTQIVIDAHRRGYKESK